MGKQMTSRKSKVNHAQQYITTDMEPEVIGAIEDAVTSYLEAKEQIATLRQVMKDQRELIGSEMAEHQITIYNVHIFEKVFTVTADQEQKVKIKAQKQEIA